MPATPVNTAPHDFDVLIVGSGLAGLSAALHLAPTHRVAVLTKRSMSDGSSGWAQGGIAAVMAEGDSFQSHVDDTLVAGAGLSDLAATRFVVEHSPESIDWLRRLGVPFSLEDGHLHLTREGGHSARRIVHATDATGAAVQRTLIDHVRNTPNITVFEQHTLVDLITSRKLGLPCAAGPACLGLYALDEATDEVLDLPGTADHPGHRRRRQGVSLHHQSRHGHRRRHRRGLARRLPGDQHGIHPVPSHLPVSPQRQVVPDQRSGARRRRTAVVARRDALHAAARSPARTRAARRGRTGHRLRDEEARPGVRVPRHLAPARGLHPRALPDHSRALPGAGHRHHAPAHPGGARRRTTPAAACTPTCPGGPTSPGCTRSARPPTPACTAPTAWPAIRCWNAWCSRRAAAHDILATPLPTPPTVPAWDVSRVTDADESVVISHNWDELRRFMWDYVGIVRTNKRLERAAHRIRLLQEEIQEFYANFHVTRDLLELRNLVTVADLIVKSRAGAPRKPGPALQPRLSANAAGRRPDDPGPGAGALAGLNHGRDERPGGRVWPGYAPGGAPPWRPKESNSPAGELPAGPCRARFRPRRCGAPVTRPADRP